MTAAAEDEAAYAKAKAQQEAAEAAEAAFLKAAVEREAAEKAAADEKVENLKGQLAKATAQITSQDIDVEQLPQSLQDDKYKDL